MISLESVGKNLEQAIDNGLAQLKVSREDVNIKIIDAGGIFKKAKVILTVDKDVEANLKLREEKVNEAISETEITNQEQEIKAQENAGDEQEVKVQEEIVQTNTQIETNSQNAENCEVKMTKSALAVKDYLVGLFDAMDTNAQVSFTKKGDSYDVQIDGEDLTKLIGFRGEGLNGIQNMCNIMASKEDRNAERFFVNAGTFKQEREQSLIRYARRMAYQCTKTKQPIKLDYMSAFERKIVHNALSKDELVETHSEGEEPKRYLIIVPK